MASIYAVTKVLKYEIIVLKLHRTKCSPPDAIATNTPQPVADDGSTLHTECSCQQIYHTN